MAENESLDLRHPGGQRWNHVFDAVRKKQVPKEVARIAARKLPAALRKAFKEFAEHGASFERFLAARDDPNALERYVRECQGHPYAHLFAQTAAMKSASTNQDLIRSYISGIFEQLRDQISQYAVGTAMWRGFPEIKEYLREVQRHLEPEMARIATKLAENPNWRPTCSRSKKGDKTDPTRAMLDMSLLGPRK